MIESRLVNNWLTDRKNLIVNLVALSETKSEPAITQLRSFCDGLVDYVSAAHFQVYDEIVSGSSAQDLLHAVYPTIQDSTEKVLAFHDSLSATFTNDNDQLRETLGDISLALESRFELEDELIDAARQAEQHTIH